MAEGGQDLEMEDLSGFPPIPEDNIDNYETNTTFEDDNTTYNTGNRNLTSETSFTTPERARVFDPGLV
ncbi:hypothetical protein, partial [Bartonella sp. CL45QHWL]|uniref:hypothetical protein n=1 Tax=Bartonella sp. CL45QHWL TaxID=3243533 RepID=UPI0035CEAAF4